MCLEVITIYTEKELNKAKNYALRLLTYRPRSESELAAKLKQKKFSSEVIKAVVEIMKEYNYIDDRKFALQWVEYRLSVRPMGSKLIKYELKKFGINEEIIAEVISGIDNEAEINLARNLVNKKIAQRGKVSLQSISGLLQRRGFSYETIYKVLSDLGLIS